MSENSKPEKTKKEKKDTGEKVKDAPLNPDGTLKSKGQLRAERRQIQDAQRAAKSSASVQLPKSQSNNVAQSTQSNKKSTEGVQRVAYNVLMDDPIAQKKVSKKLAKQNVPQRNTQEQKKVNLFSHLHQYEEDLSLTKDISFLSTGTIHPVIIKLGLQYAKGIISGSNARCIALLYAFKQVINDYTVPPSKELARDLEMKIKPCISFLSQCRHLSVSMGNAIKYLKQQITNTPHDLLESEAKQRLTESIDNFINERIVLADKAISDLANSKIENGDKILIYGFSSLIIKVLKDANANGKQFQVVIVDSRPDFQGRESLTRLANVGIKCSYVLISAISYIMKEVTSVFIGAHALLANGNVMGSAGCAMVCMVAKANNVPVLACCETYKFCERVQTDAFVYNELADPDVIVNLNNPALSDVLIGWREIKSLYLLNLVYDVTPSKFVDIAITELGMIPCTSVPVVLRVKSSET
ncbi:translation initiation factor eIF2B subunit delta isoform X1 [Hydra vulgaris]|nr:translation initiation factor eIF-2B subunit delta [Hydra vulgaris]